MTSLPIIMAHRPADDPPTLGEPLRPVPTNLDTLEKLRQLGMGVNLLVQHFNALVTAFLAVEADYLTSTFAGSSYIVTVGTVVSGTWAAGTIDATYLGLSFDDGYSVLEIAGVVGLDGDVAAPGNYYFYSTNDEGTKGWYDFDALMQTYVGAPTIVTVGTVVAGTWQADVIDHERGGLEADVSAYDGLVKITGGNTFAVTIGIADDNMSPVASGASIAVNDYAKFAAGGLVGQTYAQVKTDLSLNNVENTALTTWTGAATIVLVGTIGTGIWQGTPIADAYIASAATWDAKQGALTHQHSVAEAGDNVNLVNDSASPGASKYYGTNAGSTKGWYDLPTIATGGPNRMLGMNTAGTAFEWKTFSGITNQIYIQQLGGQSIFYTPQDIHTGARPTFAGLTLTGGIQMSWS